MSVLLHQRLIASQTAPEAVVSLDSAIEVAIRDLRRIDRVLIRASNPPGAFTRRKLVAIASRLIQAAVAPEIESALSAVELPADVEASISSPDVKTGDA